MKLRSNDRLLLAGKTGSGKTWLAQRLTANIPRLVVLDSKASLGSWSLREPSPLDWRRFNHGGKGRFRILPPIVYKPAEWFEELFQRLYEVGNVTLYIDEAYAVIPPGGRAGKWLTALYTRGRESGIGVWASTQRPTLIPIFLISEADALIMFRLSMEEDRKRMASIMGKQVMANVKHEHGFWLYDVKDETPYYYPTAIRRVRTGV